MAGKRFGREAGFSAALLTKNVSSFGRNDVVWGMTRTTARAANNGKSDCKSSYNSNCKDEN
jgi:hypothetical protein